MCCKPYLCPTTSRNGRSKLGEKIAQPVHHLFHVSERNSNSDRCIPAPARTLDILRFLTITLETSRTWCVVSEMGKEATHGHTRTPTPTSANLKIRVKRMSKRATIHAVQDPVLPMSEVLAPTLTTVFPVIVPEINTTFLASPATALVTIYV